MRMAEEWPEDIRAAVLPAYPAFRNAVIAAMHESKVPMRRKAQILAELAYETFLGHRAKEFEVDPKEFQESLRKETIGVDFDENETGSWPVLRVTVTPRK